MNKMLIIDNNPIFVNSVKTAFEANSYRVVTSENGAESLENVRRKKTLKTQPIYKSIFKSRIVNILQILEYKTFQSDDDGNTGPSTLRIFVHPFTYRLKNIPVYKVIDLF